MHYLAIKDPLLPYVDISYLMVREFAKKLGADLNLITERRYPNFPVFYEVVQVYQAGMSYDWNLYFRPGVLLGDDVLNPTMFAKPGHVSICFAYDALVHFDVAADAHFVADKRNMAIGDVAVMADRLAHDVWRPLDGEYNLYMDVVTDAIKSRRPASFGSYTLSKNIARKKLPTTGLFPPNSQFEYLDSFAFTQRSVEEHIANVVRQWRNSPKSLDKSR